MKIAFFTNGYPLVSEAFIQTSVLSLISREQHVDVFGIGNAEATGFAVNTDSIDSSLHTHASATWSACFGLRLLKLPQLIARFVAKRGFRKLPAVSPRMYRRSFADLTAWFQLNALPADGRYDILHCQFATLGEFVTKHRSAGFLDGKLVCHFRGYDITEVPRALGEDVYNRLWTEADGFIANCQHFADRAVALGCPPEKLVVIGSGIDMERFSYRQPTVSVSKNKHLKCLLVGRLVARKGFDDALKALAIVRDQTNYKIDVEIIGAGEEKPNLEALAVRLGLQDDVRFSGEQPHAYVAQRLAAADILLSPSRTTANGGQDAPVNTLKEAMASGTISVATRHGGIPELVEHCVTGFLGEENNPVSLAEAVMAALKQEEKWPIIARQAREKVIELYEIGRVTERQLSFYRSLFDQSATVQGCREMA